MTMYAKVNRNFLPSTLLFWLLFLVLFHDSYWKYFFPIEEGVENAIHSREKNTLRIDQNTRIQTHGVSHTLSRSLFWIFLCPLNLFPAGAQHGTAHCSWDLSQGVLLTISPLMSASSPGRKEDRRRSKPEVSSLVAAIENFIFSLVLPFYIFTRKRTYKTF